MLDGLKGCLPVRIEQNCLLERVSETSVIIRVESKPLDKTNSLNISLQARNAVVKKWLVCIEKHRPIWLIDYVIAYDSLLLEFDSALIEFNGLIHWLKSISGEFISKDNNQMEEQGKNHEIKVCYQYSGKNHPNYMLLVEQFSGLSANEIIQLHQNTTYQVFAIGFMPNFAYLGELSPALSVPRLKEPRLKVPAGAVAITDNQTAVYPNESPGGWHIIGYTNFSFGDGLNSVIGPNDNVSFKSVDLNAFLRESKRSSDRYV